eukprot:TRINITY_DN3948_c0_g1_i1.p1 TRINITY_DN3948_c0_g1~~TRINITY_DN3948_c0_g1_i1.p1  ORF type:complete len:281 (-),score=88.97 TRINITY_DN3948_c0_g1_i1:23-865(-)
MSQGPSRDLEGAKAAYKQGDASAAMKAHQSSGEEDHKEEGAYIKSVVYGGLDGIITTFAVVSAVAGGNLSLSVVLILGFANLIADGISMGLGDYISTRAEIDYAEMERRREAWECEQFLDLEKKEMVELYESKGLSKEDATTVVNIISKDQDVFVDIMMVEELSIMPPPSQEEAMMNGCVTFGSFLFFGVIPLLAFVVAVAINPADTNDLGTTFLISCLLTAATLFILGALTSKFSHSAWYIAGFKMLINGAVAAAASYLIGMLVSYIVLGDASAGGHAA